MMMVMEGIDYREGECLYFLFKGKGKGKGKSKLKMELVDQGQYLSPLPELQ